MPYNYNMPYNYMPQIQMPTPAVTAQPQHVERVHGEAGVDQYTMAPNSDVILLDETAPMIWFVQTDAAGYKTKHPYDIVPHEKKEEPKISDYDEKINSIESRLSAIEEALK